MSEFLAEARVRVLPDTSGFRVKLQEDINRAIAQARIAPVQIPVVIGGSLAAAAAQTAALQVSQTAAEGTTLGLTKAAELENTAFGRQAVILEAATAATRQKAGADSIAGAAAKSHAIAQGQVGKAAIASTAGMLGLRGAVLTAGSAFIAATVGFQALGKAVGSTIDFTRQLAVFRVTAGATADEMARVAEEARALGRDITLPGVAAGDAAKTLTELSRAGLSVQESLDAARGTLQLATAAQIDNAAAAELVANALNAFQISGREAVRIADLLAGAANASQGSIVDMGLALKQVASVARLVGLNVTDTVTLLTELSRAGLSSSDAGTSLRTTLLRLVGDFPKVSREVARLGLELRDVNGAIRPQFFSELGTQLKKMTPAARQATVALLGGSDAIRAIGILSRSTAAEFDVLQAQISKAGIAQDVAAAQTEGLGGDVEAAKNQFADLGLTVGKVVSGPLSLFVKTAGAAAGAANELNTAVGESAGGGGFFSTFGDVLDGIQDSFSNVNISFQQGIRAAQSARGAFLSLNDALGGTSDILKRMQSDFDGAIAKLKELAAAAVENQNAPQDSGKGVQGILNRVTGFDTAETAARIRGDNEALLAVLQAEQDFLEQQLDRRFVKNRPALFRKLQAALLGVVNDITTIGKQGASGVKSAAAEAARVANEADAALLQVLSDRRSDAERKAEAAGRTQGLADDIQAQNRIQALIKAQIAKIRDRIKDEQTRKAAIRELRIALISSRAEEEKLRQEQKQQAKDAANEILDIRIQIAETKGQVKLEQQLLQIKIKKLRAQIKAAKGDRLLQAQLRLELAQTQKQLADISKIQKDTANQQKSIFFEFLQTQQGFAANLLGNLIPGFATKGLVGGSTPDASQAAFDTGRRPAAEAALATSRERGVRPVQVDTTNHLLRQILAAVSGKRYNPPEVAYNKAASGGAMDTL